jgi:hypothetical protein
MSRPSDIEKEIARLMRDPNALRSERKGLQRPDGRDHYDPNQPRVPAGDPKGGQWTGTGGGYRGASDRDARVRLASLDAAQLAQLGSGNPRDAYAQLQPFDNQLGFFSPAQNRRSQNGFIETDNDPRRNRRTQDFETTRYRFVSQGPVAREPIPGGTRWILTSTTYAHDRTAGAYATISATPARPMMIITDSHGQLFVRPFIREFDSR